MAQRLVIVFVVAISCAVVAFVGAGLLSGRYPLGPDQRPWCSGTGIYGLTPACRGGPPAADWFEPSLWPAIGTFCVVALAGVIALRKRSE